jgi:hypothetical protein
MGEIESDRADMEHRFHRQSRGCAAAVLVLVNAHIVPDARLESILAVSRHYAEASPVEHFAWRAWACCGGVRGNRACLCRDRAGRYRHLHGSDIRPVTRGDLTNAANHPVFLKAWRHRTSRAGHHARVACPLCRQFRQNWPDVALPGAHFLELRFGLVTLRPRHAKLLLILDRRVGFGLVDLGLHLVDFGIPLIELRLSFLDMLLSQSDISMGLFGNADALQRAFYCASHYLNQ